MMYVFDLIWEVSLSLDLVFFIVEIYEEEKNFKVLLKVKLKLVRFLFVIFLIKKKLYRLLVFVVK